MNSRSDISSATIAAIAGFASLVEQMLFYGVDTGVKRYQYQLNEAQKKIYSWNELKPIVFGEAYSKGVFAKFQSLHRGFGVATLYKASFRAMIFCGQDGSVKALNGMIGNQLRDYWGDKNAAVMLSTGGGFLTGLVATTLLTPPDTIKTKLQNQDPRSVWQIAAMERANLFKGVGITLFRNIPGTGAQFGAQAATLAQLGVTNSQEATFSQQLLSCTVGGIAATAITNPQDLIKTVLMTQNGSGVSTKKVAQQLIGQLGLFGICTKGLAFRIVQSGPKFALPMVVFEELKKRW